VPLLLLRRHALTCALARLYAQDNAFTVGVRFRAACTSCVAQSATARALGGPEIREQFATRILARYSMNAWRMLAPEIHPAPKSTKHPGRAQVVIGGTARETQVLFFTDAEAREWATSDPVGLEKSSPQVKRRTGTR
jgi:hypothetical protein